MKPMEENSDLIMMLFLGGAGLFSILASIFNWNFFFENRRAQLFMKLFGRTGARVFYGVLGFALLAFATSKII